MYGESVFTTMRMSSGRIHDWKYHFDRLKKGVEYVYGPFSDGAGWESVFEMELSAALRAQTGDKILRLTVYLEQERGLSLKRPLALKDLKVALFSTERETSDQGQKNFNLRSCPAPLKPDWWPGFLKAGNYLEILLLQKTHLRIGDDDLLFVSPKGTVLESSVANIFFVSHNKLYTPPVSAHVLAGTMRRKVIESATEFFESCHETEAPLDRLLKAEAIFGTNSIRGPFLIGRIDESPFHYSQDFSGMFDRLRKRVLT